MSAEDYKRAGVILDELAAERAARAAGKKPHVSKAQKRADRLKKALERNPEERAGIAIRAIMEPAFGRLLSRYDLGGGVDEKLRLRALETGAERILAASGYFVEGLQVRAVPTPGTGKTVHAKLAEECAAKGLPIPPLVPMRVLLTVIVVPTEEETKP